jgi:hypothetical protein
MACGRMVFCSPVPSYVKVSELSVGEGIRICQTPEEWEEALEGILTGEIDLEQEEMAAKSVVEKNYSTLVVAEKHAAFVRSFLSTCRGSIKE